MTDDSKRDYEVGYGKPPLHSRYRPGQSGNAEGRPRGARNLAVLLKVELDKRVSVREGGKVRRVRKRDAVVASLINKALQGDVRATQLLVQLLQRFEADAAPPAAENASHAQDDAEILATFLARRQAGKGADE